jgi:Protein of unknown function (DUF2851)
LQVFIFYVIFEIIICHLLFIRHIMKEEFLHFVWQNKQFNFANLETTKGEPIQILQTGSYLQQSGPDFFNAHVVISDQKWAGNVEIHLKSSDWYHHHHETDTKYDNVILHVVWEHDTEVLRKNNSEIPVLVLKKYVDQKLVDQYLKLKAQKSWINCEKEIHSIPQFIFKNWHERLFFERLQQKSLPIIQLLQENNSDWEATFFCVLAKNFGLNTNGEPFLQMAKTIPFSVVRKESFDVHYLEALFFGSAKMIPQEPDDVYVKELQNVFQYIAIKYNLQDSYISPIQFYKLRPDNFPTLRLAQLAMLYHTHRNLFSKVIAAKTISELYSLFSVSVSDYWQSHYNFDKPSKSKEKSISKSFIDLLIINSVLPIKFAYEQSIGNEISEETIYFLEKIKPEKNTIIEKFEYHKIQCHSAFESQALLQLKKEYCDKGKCLKCAIGHHLLKN